MYFDPREIDAITRILEEIRDKHTNLDDEDLIHIVAIEAERYGIKPTISVPIARQLIEKDDFYMP
jgi:predicted transcriptional regulator